MIISVSRRTDIPAFFSTWFFNRLKAGEALARNPMNPRQVSRLLLNPDTVDGFVFWSKNPQPMIFELKNLDPYPFYFQFTLTPYGKDIEPYLPKKEILVDTFKHLSDATSPKQIPWRYDPILLSPTYTLPYHIDAFEKMARALCGYTNHCTISVLDSYQGIEKNMSALHVHSLKKEDMLVIAKAFSQIAKSYRLKLYTCCEEISLEAFDIHHGKCIDGELLSQIGGLPFESKKDPNQRKGCNCTQSIDIGLYNTCQNGCKYCYANHSPKLLQKNLALYDPNSPLLCSQLQKEDNITDRKMSSFKKTFEQKSFF